MTAALTSPSTHTGARTSSDRRHEYTSSRSCSVLGRAGSPSARTRSRTPSGAAVGSARRSRTSSSNSRSKSVSVAGIAHHLLESFQGPAQSRRAGSRADSEHAGHGRPVELEQNAQRNHFTLGRRQASQRRLELAGAERRLFRFREVARIALLPPPAPLLRTEVIERGRARDSAEPRTGTPTPGIEAPPDAKRLFEGLACQVFRHRPVTGEEQQVAVHRVELRLGDR